VVLAAIAAGCVLAAAGTAGVVLAGGSSTSEQGASALSGGTASLSERAFLDYMIPHHEMAVQMADIAMNRTGDLRVREVARDVLAEQPWEITLMTRWRQQWFGVPPSARVTMTSADSGIMGMAADMGALRRARPFPVAFYDDMIPHHAGAVVMAQRVLLGHPRPQLAHLARVIMATQSTEIGKMERYRGLATRSGSSPLPAPARRAPAAPVTPA
jgi:uncharacterized protein (DUF305 family)